MAYIKRWAGLNFLNIENGKIKEMSGMTQYLVYSDHITDFYGRTLYRFQGEYVCEYGSGMRIYSFRNGVICDMAGRSLYRTDGKRVIDYQTAMTLYEISEPISREELFAFLVLYVLPK